MSCYEKSLVSLSIFKCVSSCVLHFKRDFLYEIALKKFRKKGRYKDLWPKSNCAEYEEDRRRSTTEILNIKETEASSSTIKDAFHTTNLLYYNIVKQAKTIGDSRQFFTKWIKQNGCGKMFIDFLKCEM